MLDEATRRCDRSHFDERLAAQLQEAAQQHRGLAVLIAGADGIAWINKRWGRAAGDSVLRKLARRSWKKRSNLGQRYERKLWAHSNSPLMQTRAWSCFGGMV